MLCIPYHRWPAVYPQWANYLQWLVRLHALKTDHVYLLTEDHLTQASESDHIEQLNSIIKRKLSYEFDLAFHFLTFQSAEQALHHFYKRPSPIEQSALEEWALSQNGYCQSQFYLGHHPFKQCWDALEYAGNRWWPTRAWCRGWKWSFGEHVF
jgi:hypothetical protein